MGVNIGVFSFWEEERGRKGRREVEGEEEGERERNGGRRKEKETTDEERKREEESQIDDHGREGNLR